MTLKHVLVVNMNYLGDALMTTPAIRAIKAAFDGVKVDVIAGSTANYGALEILSLDPDIDKLIPRVNRGSLARGKQLFSVIKSDDYDLVVVLPTLPFYSTIARLTGRRVILVPKADETKHMADHMLDSILPLLKIDKPDRSLILSVPEQAEAFATTSFTAPRSAKGIVTFNVGASRPQKRWPATNFALTVRKCITAGLDVFLVGGDNEQDKATVDTVLSEVSDLTETITSNVVNLVGKTTLEQLAGVVKASSVLVTGDTGAMHIASALNIPLIALFGSTSPRFTGPYGEGRRTIVLDLGLACAPCLTHPTCNGRYDCMVGIRPEQVFESILRLIAVPEEYTACGMT